MPNHSIRIRSSPRSVLSPICVYNIPQVAETEPGARSAAAAHAADMDRSVAAAAAGWAARWAAAFTPRNGHYSGHLPTFAGAAPVARLYYLSVVSFLSVEKSVATRARSSLTVHHMPYSDSAMITVKRPAISWLASLLPRAFRLRRDWARWRTRTPRPTGHGRTQPAGRGPA